MTEIDPATNLPKLPEGYFWRVKLGSLGIYKLELRKRMWVGSRVIYERRLPYYDKNTREVLDPTTVLQNAASFIMKDFDDPWTEFLGDYPPKQL